MPEPSRSGVVRRWRQHDDAMPLPFDVEQELEEHFGALHDLLERAGHRPFGRLELRMPGQSFEAGVVYRWERSDAP